MRGQGCHGGRVRLRNRYPHRGLERHLAGESSCLRGVIVTLTWGRFRPHGEKRWFGREKNKMGGGWGGGVAFFWDDDDTPSHTQQPSLSGPGHKAKEHPPNPKHNLTTPFTSFFLSSGCPGGDAQPIVAGAGQDGRNDGERGGDVFHDRRGVRRRRGESPVNPQIKQSRVYPRYTAARVCLSTVPARGVCLTSRCSRPARASR